MYVRLIFFIVSLVLYLKSPDVYDWTFCFWCMMIYLAEVAICVGKEFKQGHFLTFNLIFFFSFFWTSFAYPVLLFDTPAGYLNIMMDHINWDVLSHSTSLCLLFASTYILAYGDSAVKSDNRISQFRSTVGRSKLWLIIAFVILIAEAFMYLYRSGFNYADFAFDVAFWDVYFVLLALCLIEQSKNKSDNPDIWEFIRLNKFPVFSGLFIMILFMMFGDRGPALKTLLVCGAIYYYYYKKIRFTRIVLIGGLGVALMFFIRQTRAYGSLFEMISDVSVLLSVFDLKDGVLYMFADLYGATMELNVAYDYALNHELFHPERILAIPLTAVPYLPTLVLGLFGTSTAVFNTGAELNRQMSAFNSQFGNHVVGDLFMSTGMLGVVVFAFLLGLVSRKLAVKRFESESFAVAYMMLFSYALYLPRDSVFTLVRPLALSFILLYFILPKKKQI